MSDTWTPSGAFGGAGGGGGKSAEAEFYQQVSNRVKLITSTSPWLANSPDVIQALASDGTLTPQDLATQSAAMTGQINADAMATNIRKMDPSGQRLVWGNMTDSQRGALKQLGYDGPPRSDTKGFLEQHLGSVGSAIDKVVSGPGGVIGDAVGDVFDAMIWIGDQPAHLYRAIRTMDDDAQQMALGGALVGLLGAVAAPFTGGLSLGLTIGAYGGGALLGATAGAALTHPGQWVDAMSNTWDGEKVFTRDSQKAARALIGNDSTLNSLVADIAYDGDLYELASDFAGERDSTSKNTLLHTVDKVAKKIVDPGDPRYSQVTAGLAKVIADPRFMQAVQTLQAGKISFGRDAARSMGLSPNSSLYNMVSGGLDGVWLITLDPLLGAGKFAEWNKVRRFGVPILEGAVGAEQTGARIARLFDEQPSVRRAFDIVADGINRGDPNYIKKWMPDAQSIVPDLIEHRNLLRAQGLEGAYTREHILDWYKRGDGIKAMNAGRGTVKAEAKLILPHMGVGSYGWAKSKNYVKGVIDLADDAHLNKIAKAAGEDITPEAFIRSRPGATPAMDFAHDVEMVRDRYGRTAAVMDVLTKIPGVKGAGAFLGSVTTMIPAGGSVALVGPKAALDIDKFAELGRVLGMTSDERALWKAMMLDQSNPAMRAVAAESFLDSLLTVGGIKNLPEGAALSDKFLVKYHQTYALGGLDEMIVGGRLRKIGVLPVADQALELVVPDLKALRQAVRSQTFTKYLLNAADARFVETGMNKYWKPAVLLRLGFIPRAAGEELLAAMLRIGPSTLLAEQGERSIAQGKLAGMTRDEIDAFRAKAFDGRPGLTRLTTEQFAKVDSWHTAAHMRPLERMLARGRWEEPIKEVLHRYSSWLRETLADGVLTPGMVEAIPERIKLAALGNERSLRHFILTGSNREMQESALAFQSLFGDSLMKAVSASNAGIFDRGVRQNIITHQTPDAANPGELVEEQYLRTRGVFANYERGDWQYNNAIHEQLQRFHDDPIVREINLDTLTRHRPEFPNLDASRAADLALNFDRVGKGSPAMKRIIAESLDGKALTAVEWRALQRDLRASGELSARQVEELRIVLPDSEIEPREIIDGIRTVLRNSSRTTAKHKVLAKNIEDVDLFLGQLDNLDDVERGWLAPFLEHGAWDEATLMDGSYWIDPADFASVWEERMAAALAHPANQTAMRTSIYGVQTPTEAAVLNPVPDGMARVYNPTLSPTSVERLSAQLASHATPGADPMANVHAAVDSLMAQWKRTTKSIGEDLSRYDDVAEDFFGTLVQKHGQLGDLATTTRRLDRTGPVPLSIYAVDDPNVASALSATLRDYVGASSEAGPGLNRLVSFMDIDRGVAAGRPIAIDGLEAPFRGASGATGWRADPAALHARAEMVPPTAEFQKFDDQWSWGTSAEQSMREWSTVIRERFDQVNRAGTRQMFFNRGDQPIYRSLPTIEGGKARKFEIPAGEQLTKGVKYLDSTGKEIRFGDSRFMDQIVEQADDAPIMWDIVGPALRDAGDDVAETVRYAPTGERVFRSKVEQIAMSDAKNLPDGALSVMMSPYKQGTWEKVVGYGFDRVIGPAIDAIVRRPLAFHEFANARATSRKLADSLLLDRDLIHGTIPTHFASHMEAVFPTEAARAEMLEHGRRISRLADDPVDHLDDEALLEWLDGLGHEGRVKLRDRADTRIGWGEFADEDAAALYASGKAIADAPDDAFHYAKTSIDRNLEFAKATVAKLGKSLDAPWSIAKTHATIGALERGTKAERQLFRALDEGGWSLMQTAKTNLANVERTINELAVERAIANTVPFLDSHEVRSQFSEYGRNMLPFWYAEENFMKRWANTVRVAPESIRKAQLTYMGMKSVGVVRTDANGKDWFVYPGSQTLIEALDKVPGLSMLPIGAAFQAQPQNMLPGFNRVGVPSMSPLITLPVDVATSFFPELRPIQTALGGGRGVNQGIARHLIPTQLYNVWEAAFGDENSSPRYASAMVAAAAYMEAHGRGLSDDADANETDEYMRDLKDHARVIMISQALVGFVAPGSPQQVVGGENASATGIGLDDESLTLHDEYLRLVRLQGLEEGTAAYMANHTLEELANPLAYTVGKTETTSGSLLPATAQAVAFYDQHAEYLHQFPDAAGYLLPPDEDSTDANDINAYTEQTLAGLRKRRTPAEFLTAIKYKEGAFEYYRSRDSYLTQMQMAGDDEDRKSILTSQWESWSAIYKAQHPVFADQLESSDGRQRRANTLQQLRVALRDPEAPGAWHTSAMAEMVNIFDAYQATISSLADDRSTRTRKKVDAIKAGFADYMERYVLEHPELSPLWTSVMKPESSL